MEGGRGKVPLPRAVCYCFVRTLLDMSESSVTLHVSFDRGNIQHIPNSQLVKRHILHTTALSLSLFFVSETYMFRLLQVSDFVISKVPERFNLFDILGFPCTIYRFLDNRYQYFLC